jgi:hypothetical protein
VGGIPDYLHNWQADNDGGSIRFPEISVPELLYVRLRTRSIAVLNRSAYRCPIKKGVRVGRSNHLLRHRELHTSFFYCYHSGILHVNKSPETLHKLIIHVLYNKNSVEMGSTSTSKPIPYGWKATVLH